MSEQEIITRYDPLLWKHVHNFKSRCTGRTISDEDLIQTARMAFLQFVRYAGMFLPETAFTMSLRGDNFSIIT